MPRGFHWRSMRNRYICRVKHRTVTYSPDNTVRSHSIQCQRPFSVDCFLVCSLGRKPFLVGSVHCSFFFTRLQTCWTQFETTCSDRCPLLSKSAFHGYVIASVIGEVHLRLVRFQQKKRVEKCSIGKHQPLKNKLVTVQTIDFDPRMRICAENERPKAEMLFLCKCLATADCFHLKHTGKS